MGWLISLPVLGAFSVAFNLFAAHECAQAGDYPLLVIQCAALSALGITLVRDVRRTINALREWQALRRSWEQLRAWGERQDGK